MSEIRKRQTKTNEMSRITFRHPEFPAPHLNGPYLHFDLESEAEKLRDESIWELESRNAITLAKYNDLRVVLIAMKSGARMEGHKAYGSISIHALTGKLRVHLQHHTMIVTAGELVVLEQSQSHDIEAVEDSSFLLSISWAKGA